MSAILKRELSAYFNSAIAYVAMTVIFIVSGFLFAFNCFLGNSSSLSSVFGYTIYIIVFIVPIITMKTFAEEKRQRSDQALLTSPVSLTGIVMGKFLAAFILYCICCCIFIIYSITISFFTSPDWSVNLCTFIGMILFGGALIAIDMFFSVLTESTIIAAILGIAFGAVISFTSMINYAISNVISVDWISTVFEKINFTSYYSDFTYGMLNISNVLFFVSVAGLFIFFTVRVLEKRRWS
jgi:ABC-2 type transport system permease protein